MATLWIEKLIALSEGQPYKQNDNGYILLNKLFD